jgi:crotonobetaine/carnitine-CoA ligase
METIGTLLERKAAENKNKPYLYFLDKEISYEDIDADANRMANAFSKLGVTKGDHVAIMLPNCPEYLYCWFGLAKLGALTVTINTQFRGESLKYLVEASDSQLVVVAPDFLPQYDEIAPKIKGVRRVVFDTTKKAGNNESLDTLFRESPTTPFSDVSPIEDIEPLIITFTSGTTGLPKLVRNSHRVYITAAQDLVSYAELSAEDRLYSSLPLYHVNPQVYCVLTALVASASVIVAPRFSASRFWDDVRKYQATAFSYVGAVLPILLTQPENTDDKDVPARKCFGGGAPKEVYEKVSQRFGIEVLEMYGMSETGTWNTINRPGRGRAGTTGELREGFEVRIFDDRDNELPPGEIGEIVVRPKKPFIMFDGYYKSPEETMKCSANWWFHTGDLGKVDDEGYYYFCGRKKESIRRGGENIPPYEIEKEINEHPAVAESAAFGITDPIMGEEIKVAIVLRPGQKVTHEEIIAWCEQRLPKFMLPRYIEFMENLPKSASEKVQKVALKGRGLTSNTWDRQKHHS